MGRDFSHSRLGFDGLTGHSVVRTAVESIGQGIAASEYAGRFFDNDATPRGVLEMDGYFKDPAGSGAAKKIVERFVPGEGQRAQRWPFWKTD